MPPDQTLEEQFLAVQHDRTLDAVQILFAHGWSVREGNATTLPALARVFLTHAEPAGDETVIAAKRVLDSAALATEPVPPQWMLDLHSAGIRWRQVMTSAGNTDLQFGQLRSVATGEPVLGRTWRKIGSAEDSWTELLRAVGIHDVDVYFDPDLALPNT